MGGNDWAREAPPIAGGIYSPEKLTPTLITDRESARAAALASVTTYCGWCGAPHGDTRHNCWVPDEVKQAHLEGAKREYQALSRFTPPPCQLCGEPYPPGAAHDCGYPTAPLSHDVAAAQFQQKSFAAQLKEVNQ